MKKILNISLLLVLGVIIASCSNKTAIYHPTNEDVSFEVSSFGALATDEEQPYILKIQRGVAKQELNVPLTFSSYTIEEDAEGNKVIVNNNIFTLNPGAVTFAAGEYTKTLAVSYTYADMEPGVDYYFHIQFNSDVAGPAGYNELTGAVKMKLNYVDYLSADPWLYGSRIGGYVHARLFECLQMDVTLQRAAGTDNYYKLRAWKDPADPDNPDADLFALEFQYDASEDEMIITSYPGYNDGLSTTSISGYPCWYYTFAYSGITYRGYPIKDYCYVDKTSGQAGQLVSGDEIDLMGWYWKTGGYYAGGYTIYDFYVLEDLDQ